MKTKVSSDVLIPVVLAVLIATLLVLAPGFQNSTWRLYDLSLLLKPGVEEASELVIANIDDRTIEELNSYPLGRDIIAAGLIGMAEFGAEVLGIDNEYLETSPRVVREDFFAEDLPASFRDVFDSVAAVNRQIVEAVLPGGGYSAAEAPELLGQFSAFAEGERDYLLSVVSESIRDNDVYLGGAGKFFGRVFATVTPAQAQVGVESEETDNSEAYGSTLLAADQIEPEHLELIRQLVPLENVEVVDGADPFQDSEFISPVIYPILQGMAGAGSVAQHVDDDGVRRRIDLLFKFEGRYYPHLSLAILLEWFGNPRVRIEKDALVLLGAEHPQLGHTDIRLPLDQEGRFLINWPKDGFLGSFRHVPFLNLWYNHHDFSILEGQLRTLDAIGLLDPLGFADLKEILPRADRALEAGMETGDRAFVQEYRELRASFLTRIQDLIDAGVADQGIAYFEDYLTLPDLGPEEAQNIRDSIQILTDLRGAIPQTLANLNQVRETLKEEFEGSVVVLGYSGKSTTDIGVNPFENEYMNVGTFPAMLNTVYQGKFLTDRPWWISLLIVLPFGLLVPFLFQWMSPGRGLALSLGILALVVVAFFVVFAITGVYLDQLVVLSYLTPTILVVLVVNFRRTNSQKTFITDAFGQYLSEEVISELIEDPEKLQLGGEERVMTAMFTDVKGFSTISEALDPTSLVRLLNDYLSAMSDEVLDQRGTIDKFEGDAIIAFFGAPVRLEDHATRTCTAALRMRAVEEDLNQRFLAEKMTPSPLMTRIGINSGPMVVGNMGTQRKKNYTIMGSAVNLAARLEGVNKQYGTWILLSDSTYEDLGGKFVCRRLDRVRVVGIHKPVQLYELLGLADGAGAELLGRLDMFEDGLKLFEARDYARSEKVFGEYLQTAKDDGPATLYYKRSQEFQKKPMPENWDGVFNLTSK